MNKKVNLTIASYGKRSVLVLVQVYRRAVRIGDAVCNLMGQDPLNNSPILEDKLAELEVSFQVPFLLSYAPAILC